MAPQTRIKRGHKDDDYDVASETSIAVTKKPRSYKTQPRVTKRKSLPRVDLEEYDEDEGREQSRGFQKMAQIFETCTSGEAKKSQVHLKAFQKGVKEKVADLRALISQREHNLVDNRKKYAAVFTSLCRAMERDTNAPNDRQSQREELFKGAQVAGGSVKSIMTQARAVEEGRTTSKLNLAETEWTTDKRDLNEVLELGCQHGKMLVECALDPDSSMPPPHPHETSREKIPRSLFPQDVLDGETWGEVAQEQINRMTALAETLP